ncbi:20S proteasome alpha/beta subunit [Bradyrhizobium sp. AZCC 2262]|uniref:heparin lyase I family protein n=1 Tax=Bradyrhizobium sp. AZCC 2262 TaxID=3117022 RepID=UPI002FF37ED5
MAVQKPTISNFFADSGTRGDGITDANVVTVWGTADPNTTVSIYDGSTLLGTATSNSSGAWAFETPKLSDSTHSLTATATDTSGATSAPSSALSVTVIPSVTDFRPASNNWQNPIIIDGQGWFVESGNKPWSLTNPDAHTVRMEVRPGDLWADDETARSEILTVDEALDHQVFNAAYTMTVEPGAVNPVDWLSVAQMHEESGIPFSISIKGDKLQVIVNINESFEQTVYVDPKSIVRGHAYDIQIQANFSTDSTGFLKIWSDGVQIVDYHGQLGTETGGQYLKLGVYEGYPEGVTSPIAVDYSNIVLSYNNASFPTPSTYGGSTGQTGDTTAPTVASLVASGTGITAGTGTLSTGNVVTLTLNLSEAVTVAGGTPTLTLNNGGTATYTGGSGSNALTFSYTVGAGQNTADLAATAINLGTATIKDSSGNAANLAGAVANPAGTLQIDTTTPTVASLVASGTGITAGAGDLGVGKVVTLTLNLSEAVTVAGGIPTLTLNDGGIATYTGGSGSSALTFSYTVGAGQNTADLTVTAVNLGTATIKDSSGKAANLTGAVTNPSGTLQIDTTAPTVASLVASGTGITAGAGDLGVGKVVTLTLNLSEAVTVAGGTPTLTLNNGGTATYTGGSGSNALTFSYTVAAGQNTADLAVTAINQGSATIKDGAGNVANLTGAVTNPSGTLQISTTAPAAASVVASGTGITAGGGTVGTGSVVTLTVNLDGAVTVAGGKPTLTLNDGGTATYTGGSGTSKLTFSYTVAAGQNTSDLTVTGVSLNGATVKDGAGNAANLGAVVTNPSGTLQVDTSAHLTHVGNKYLLANSAGVGPAISSGGVAVTDSQMVGWTFIAAVQVGSGYQVALKATGADQYTIWNTDNNGNVISNAVGGAVSGSSSALQGIEATFHQDLNGDGTIGLVTTSVDLSGVTSLEQVANYYLLNPVGGGTGPQLKSGGSVITVDQLGGWTFIGAEKTASGYEVALKAKGADQYTVWNTDNNGNVISNAVGGAVSGSSAALQGIEASFHQDLNGDGTIGLVTTRVEALGATALDQVANYYLLNPVGGGTGPQLKSGGSVITADQLGGWTLIGAEKTASGYEVALKSGNQYTVWNTDNNGKVISNAVGGAVSGSSAALQGIEASFHQDLNGDGTIGSVTTRVESLGATALDQVANYYLLNPVGGGTGPQLKSGGSVITVDQLGGWTLIGAEKTASGYEVALKAASGNQYTVWNTDNNGNVISNAVGGAVSGSSAALQGIEASFHQDLNGDGVILLSGSGSIIGANSLVIGSGASAELTGAYSGSVSFAGATGTLVIDNSANFHGTIGGQLTTTDVIDLADITAGANATIGYTGNNSPGTLTVSDGTKTASIALLGNYSLANFTVASDGHGGTTVVDPPLPGQQESLMSENSGSDPAPSLAALDQRLALWSQHMASAFASSGWDSAGTSMVSRSELGGGGLLPQLAQSVTQRQHSDMTG